MPEYSYRWLDDAQTQPVVCACCGYPAPVERINGIYVCEICVGVTALKSEMDPAFCWIANHLLAQIKHGGK